MHRVLLVKLTLRAGTFQPWGLRFSHISVSGWPLSTSLTPHAWLLRQILPAFHFLLSSGVRRALEQISPASVCSPSPFSVLSLGIPGSLLQTPGDFISPLRRLGCFISVFTLGGARTHVLRNVLRHNNQLGVSEVCRLEMALTAGPGLRAKGGA